MALVLSTAMEAGIGSQMGVLQYRHVAIAISRRHVQKKLEEDDSLEDDADDAADLQAGHSSKIGNMLCGRSVLEMKRVVTSMRQVYRDVNLSWHSLCSLANIGGLLRNRTARKTGLSTYRKLIYIEQCGRCLGTMAPSCATARRRR
jgi:hypothetical protein